MPEKFKNKYRIGSHRNPKWNYAGNGLYFITIMVQNRLCLFGYIENKKMVPNAWGTIVNNEWDRSFKIRNELICHEYVLMPNHIHAIVEIKTDNVKSHGRVILPDNDNSLTKTDGRRFLQNTNAVAIRKPKSLSSFIAGFKSSVTTQINNFIDKNPTYHINREYGKFDRKNRLWQTNYHDNIIRDQQSLNKISNYIRTNPEKWEEDRYYQK